MKLNYNVTGAERKSLVGAISTALNAPTKYLGAPTFAYEVGNPSRADSYHIDKVGTLTGEDNLDLEAALRLAGFDADGETREYDEPDTAGGPDEPARWGECESGLGGMGALPSPEELEAEAYAEREKHRLELENQNVPDHSNEGQNAQYEPADEIPEDWENGMTEGEELGLGRQRRESFQGENGMRADDIPEPDTLTVEFPLDGFSPEAIDNLTKMVTAKEALIKEALGAEGLPIPMTADTLQFPWFTLSDPSEAAAGVPANPDLRGGCYVQFVFALCKTAKEKKRVTAKERGLADNPKYAMRCWLLSLGLIGDEFKNARKLLLARLGGNSSFKGGSRPTYTAHLYTYPNGSEADAMDCETFDFTSLAKAKAKCDEFLADCESLMFAGAHVEGDGGEYLYEILTDGTVNEK
jgi:hypothetical protein